MARGSAGRVIRWKTENTWNLQMRHHRGGSVSETRDFDHTPDTNESN